MEQQKKGAVYFYGCFSDSVHGNYRRSAETAVLAMPDRGICNFICTYVFCQ